MIRTAAFLPHVVALLVVLASHAVVSAPSSALLARSKATSEAFLQLRDRSQRLARALSQELVERHIGSAGKKLQQPEATLITGVVELPFAPALIQAARNRLAEESERLERAEQHSQMELKDKDALAAFRDYANRAPPMVLIMPPSRAGKEEDEQVAIVLGQGSNEEEPNLRGAILPSSLPSMEDDAQVLRIPQVGVGEQEPISRGVFDVNPVQAPRRSRMLRREDSQKAVGEKHVMQTHRPQKRLSSRLPADLPPLTLDPIAVQSDSSSEIGKDEADTKSLAFANDYYKDDAKIAGNSSTHQHIANTREEQERVDRIPTRVESREEPSGTMHEHYDTELAQDTATSVAKSVERMVEEMRNIQQKLGPAALEDILKEILQEPISLNGNEANSPNGSDKGNQGHARHRQALGEDTSSEVVVQGGRMVERKRKCRNGHCETWVISRESAKAPAIETEVDDEFPRSASGPPMAFPPASVPALHPFIRRHRSANGERR